MVFVPAIRGFSLRSILLCVISLLVLNASANCNNDKCLKALNSDIIQASSFCSTYTTNMAIATPSAINSGCKESSSMILSACSCINTATTTSKTSPTTPPTSKTSSSSHVTSISTTIMTSRSSSASTPAIMPSTVTVTIVQSVTASQAARTITLPGSTATTTVSASSTCSGAPCSVYELAMAPCVLTFIQEDFGDFQPNCFGTGLGPNFVKNCICPYLSQLPAALSAGPCAAADNANALAYQQSECQCLGATIG